MSVGNKWLDRLFTAGMGAAIAFFAFLILFITIDSVNLPSYLFVPVGGGYLPRFDTLLVAILSAAALFVTGNICWLLRRNVAVSPIWMYLSAGAVLGYLTKVMAYYGRLPIPFWGQ